MKKLVLLIVLMLTTSGYAENYNERLINRIVGLQESWSDLPFVYTNSRVLHLRDNNLSNPQIIQAGAEVSIDPSFLFQHFGTEVPTQEQMQRLLLNPGEVSPNIVTQNFIDAYTRRTIADYFFPVLVRTRDNQIRTGKMAFQAYARTGQLEIQRKDGSDPRMYQTEETTKKTRQLIQQTTQTTSEAIGTCPGGCETATNPQALKTAQTASAIQKHLDTTNSNPLWNKYKDFAKRFTQNRRVHRGNTGYYKNEFIKLLIQEFGEKDAGSILAAMTAYGEIPHRESTETQIAEAAAVLKVIDNRARNQHYTNAHVLKTIGMRDVTDKKVHAVLHHKQFSVWNVGDNSLVNLLNFNPDKADYLTKRRMALSFEAQYMLDNNQVEFVGRMNESKLHHYHANYVIPNWANSRKKAEPIVKVFGQEINLSKQRGATHVFYAGVP